ncbi:hypothetical protein PDE_06475 [Penicillium oxalicum 114-2]|uniref:Uncharacterized protein n=1 Tax=Penicillium oxalicum (strain 114-2 / CGMCC 5302) TaxID=933388 RepID=S7ZLJ6_PENO1|nr:hypothetical protein PDE_06475 [Penicillium oxalicum 114-2]
MERHHGDQIEDGLVRPPISRSPMRGNNLNVQDIITFWQPTHSIQYVVQTNLALKCAECRKTEDIISFSRITVDDACFYIALRSSTL